MRALPKLRCDLTLGTLGLCTALTMAPPALAGISTADQTVAGKKPTPCPDRPAILEDLWVSHDGMRLEAPLGPPVLGSPFELGIAGGPSNAPGLIMLSAASIPPLPGVDPTSFRGPAWVVPFQLDALGEAPAVVDLPSVGEAFGCSGAWHVQALVDDGGTPMRSNGLTIRAGRQGTAPFVHERADVDVGYDCALASADFDGDGLADFLVTDDDGHLVLVRSLPDGRLAAPQLVASVPAHLHFIDLAAAGDVDGDGHVDAVAVARLDSEDWTDSTAYDMAVLLNQGDGTFSETWTTLPNGIVPELLLEDFDGDDRLDILMGMWDTTLWTLHQELRPGNGDGTFQPPVGVLGGVVAAAMTAADFDVDGILDLAFFEPASLMVGIAFGAGDGTFATNFVGTYGPPYRNLVGKDVDGDGLPDLVWASADTARLSRNLGGRAFSAPELLPAPYDPWYIWVDVADMTGDGRPDVVALFSPGGVTLRSIVLQGLPGGGWAEDGPVTTVGRLGILEHVVTDVDDDGHMDLAVQTFGATAADSFLRVFHGLGNGRFQGERHAAPGQSYETATGDVDGDGHLDMVSMGISELRVFLGDGHGGHGGAIVTSVTSATGLLVADLDLDGDDDVVTSFGTPTHGIYALLSNGDGTFAAPIDTGIGPSGNVAIASLDDPKDGIPDLVVGGPSELNVYVGQGDGTFTQYSSYAATTPSAASLRDVDHDGDPDLVHFVGSGAEIEVRLGSSKSSFGAALPVTMGLSEQGRAIELADVTGDGDLDVVAIFESSSLVAVCPGAGDGTFGSPVVTDLGETVEAITTGDFDGDGREDVVAGLPSGLAFLRGRPGGALSLVQHLPADGSISDLAAGDFDRDGLPDLGVQRSFPFEITMQMNANAE